MSERRVAEQAAERVRQFLVLKSTQSGQDPQTVYALGGPDGDIVELRTADLMALVASQLGADAVMVSPRRRRTVSGPSTALDYTEALRREAAADHDTEES